jgi:hypothetical protein
MPRHELKQVAVQREKPGAGTVKIVRTLTNHPAVALKIKFNRFEK